MHLKPRKTTILLASFFAFSIFTFSGCPIGCEEEITYHDIPASSKTWVPYDGIQTFQMKHSGGAVTTFSLEGAGSDYGNFFDRPGSCDQDLIEFSNWTFTGSGPSMKIGFHLRSGWEYGDSTELAILSFRLNNDWSELFYLDADSLHSLQFTDFDLLDSLTLQGTTYQDVYLFEMPSGNALVYFDTLWYQKASGLLKFSMSSGENWELMP